MTAQYLVFTDLDGTLLDHYNYSYQAAEPTLEALERQQIPVIPTTSKTRAELIQLRQDLKNQHPFVIENGAAVFIPKAYFPTPPEDVEEIDGFWVRSFSPKRLYWTQLLESLSVRFKDQFTYFSKMGVTDIVKATGLSEADAASANEREYSEPILWIGTEERKTEFKQVLAEHGIWVIEGGRFLHLSNGCDKGKALKWLTSVYQSNSPDQPVFTIALGDSHNDVAMLEASDQPIIIKSPTKHPPNLTTHQPIIISRQCGPEGWSETLNRFLSIAKY